MKSQYISSWIEYFSQFNIEVFIVIGNYEYIDLFSSSIHKFKWEVPSLFYLSTKSLLINDDVNNLRYWNYLTDFKYSIEIPNSVTKYIQNPNIKFKNKFKDYSKNNIIDGIKAIESVKYSIEYGLRYFHYQPFTKSEDNTKRLTNCKTDIKNSDEKYKEMQRSRYILYGSK